MNVDNIFEKINPFGLYQRLVLALVGIMSSLGATGIYATIFYGAEPKFTCSLSSNTTTNDTCSIYAASRTNETTCQFDKTYYGSSFVTEWMLVCDKKYLVGLPQTIYMLGAFFGLFIGYFSDKFGRKRCCVVVCFVLSVTMICAELSQLSFLGLSITLKYVIYSASQFITGAMLNSLYSVSFILLIELTTKDFYTIVSNINLYMFVVGELVVLPIAYVSRNWHTLLIVNAAYSVVVLVMIIFLLPESPRYLVEKRRYKEADEIFKKIARINKRPIETATDSEFQSFLSQQKASKENDESIAAARKLDAEMGQEDNETMVVTQRTETTTTSSSSTSNDLSAVAYVFSSKQNVFEIVALIFLSFSLCLAYYGVSLGITMVGDVNPYVIYLFSSLSEIFGYSICHLNDRYESSSLSLFCFCDRA